MWISSHTAVYGDIKVESIGLLCGLLEQDPGLSLSLAGKRRFVQMPQGHRRQKNLRPLESTSNDTISRSG